MIQFFYGPAARFFYEEGTLVGYAVAEQGEYWRIVTSMFLHAGTDHIFSNMLILYFVGIEMERRFGHLRMLLLYFASGIAGNLLSLAAELRMHEVWRSLGASGAVFGV
ncbi:MAG: rhomboid family intramembrane serine protease, partial [Lachnospiraceae bacterium]|nr:rhomboid family intramembrane serine protease [Lachnospiraceae bacterium]